MIKWILLFLLIVPVVVGQTEMVWVMNFNYDKGQITLLDKTLKYGFFPDRNYQPEEGYESQIISFEDKVLYEFTFKQPNVVYAERSNGTDIEGGPIVYNNIDFTMVLPYYQEAEQLRIYNGEGELVGQQVIQESESKIKYFFAAIGVSILIVIWFIINRKRRRADS